MSSCESRPVVGRNVELSDDVQTTDGGFGGEIVLDVYEEEQSL